MLPAAHRLRSSGDFARTIRGGVRAGRTTLVVHARLANPGAGAPPQVGLVVSRAVGGAVQRNRVKRRLRHLLVAHVASMPPGLTLVVRALPPSAQQPGLVAPDLEAALARVRGRLERVAP